MLFLHQQLLKLLSKQGLAPYYGLFHFHPVSLMCTWHKLMQLWCTHQKTGFWYASVHDTNQTLLGKVCKWEHEGRSSLTGSDDARHQWKFCRLRERNPCTKPESTQKLPKDFHHSEHVSRKHSTAQRDSAAQRGRALTDRDKWRKLREVCEVGVRGSSLNNPRVIFSKCFPPNLDDHVWIGFKFFPSK